MSLLLTIAIPSYKEAENLKLLLPEIKKVAFLLVESAFEILVIDTQQKMDNTMDVCIQNNVKYVSRSYGNNYGDAIKTAVTMAKGEHIIIMDADGSHNPSFIEKLYNARNSADIVIASRYVKGGNTENPFYLIWMSHLLNIVYRLFLHIDCHDVSNSFKLYKTSMLKRLNLNCKHFDVVEEILVKLVKTNKLITFHEIPFRFEKRKAGKTKRKLIPFIISFIATLIRLRRIPLDECYT